MAELIIPDSRLLEPNLLIPGRKPVGPVEPNRRSRQLNSAQHYMPMVQSAGSVIDIIGGRTGDLTGNISWKNTERGTALYTPANASGGGAHFGAIDVTEWTSITVSIFVKVLSVIAGARLFSIHHSASDEIRLFLSGSLLYIDMDDGVRDRITWDMSLDVWHHLVLTHDGTTLRGYMGGAFKDSTSCSFNYSGASGALSIGKGPIGVSDSSNDAYYQNCLIANRAFSLSEIQDVYYNQYAGLQPAGPQHLIFPAASGASCALSGTITDDTEADIVTGGSTVILTLTDDTFVTGTSSANGIAAGSDSDVAATGTSWDSLIKGDLDNTDVVISTTTVTNDTATITLPPYATYDITETETITWTIPAASLTTSASPIVASPTFTVTHVAAGAIMTQLQGCNLGSDLYNGTLL